MKKSNSFSILISNVFFIFFLVAASLSISTNSTAREETGIPAGKIIHLEGEVNILSEDGQLHIKAQPQMVLKPGQMIQTGNTGWAAVILSDESIIQVNNDSLFILKKVAEKAGWLRKIGTKSGLKEPGKSEYILKKGHIWLRNKNKNQKIDIKTPYVSTSIRGTELDIQTLNNSQTRIMVLEGEITVRDEKNTIQVKALEQVTAQPGQPLEKQIIVNPKNAVQWTVSLKPFIQMFQEDMPTSSSDKIAGALDKAMQRDYAESRKAIDSLLNQSAESGPAWAFSSLMYLVVENNTEKAHKEIDEAIRLMPQSPYPLLIKSMIYQAEFNLEKAQNITEQGLRLDEENPDLLLNHAKLNYAKGYSDRALKTVNRVIEAHPASSQAYNLKGFFEFSMSHNRECIKSFQKAIKLNPYLGEAHLGLALALMETGDKEKAFEEISTAVLLEPQRSLFLSYWAKMLYEDKRFKKAEDMLNHAKMLDPKDPTPYFYLAFIYKDLHRAHDSIYSLKKQ